MVLPVHTAARPTVHGPDVSDMGTFGQPQVGRGRRGVHRVAHGPDKANPGESDRSRAGRGRRGAHRVAHGPDKADPGESDRSQAGRDHMSRGYQVRLVTVWIKC